MSWAAERGRRRARLESRRVDLIVGMIGMFLAGVFVVMGLTMGERVSRDGVEELVVVIACQIVGGGARIKVLAGDGGIARAMTGDQLERRNGVTAPSENEYIPTLVVYG